MCATFQKRTFCDLNIRREIFLTEDNFRDDEMQMCLKGGRHGVLAQSNYPNRHQGCTVDIHVSSAFYSPSHSETLSLKRPVQYFKSLHESKQMVNKDTISWAFENCGNAGLCIVSFEGKSFTIKY